MLKNLFTNKSIRVNNILDNLSQYQFFFNKSKRYVKGTFETKLFKGLMPSSLYNHVKSYQKCIAIHNAPDKIEEGEKIGNQYVFFDIYCFYNDESYADSAVGLLDIDKTYNYDRAYFCFGFEGLDCQVVTVENHYNKIDFADHHNIIRNHYNKYFSENHTNIYYYSTNYTYCYISSVQDDGKICNVNLKIVDEFNNEKYVTINIDLQNRMIDITPLENTTLKDEITYVSQYISFLLFGE